MRHRTWRGSKTGTIKSKIYLQLIAIEYFCLILQLSCRFEFVLANKVPHRSALKERRLLLHFSFVLTLHSWHRSIQHLLDQKNPQLIAFYLGTKYLQTYFHWYGAGHFFWQVMKYVFPLSFDFDIHWLWIFTHQSLERLSKKSLILSFCTFLSLL